MKSGHEGIEMYFDPALVKKFSALEQNEKNFRVAEILDRVIMHSIASFKDPISAAKLGGGAHPDRYNKLFDRLVKTRGHIDWVDISPYMIEEAKHYLQKQYPERLAVIRFIESDILEYLKNLRDQSLDLGIMKYVLSHIRDTDTLFSLLLQKLRSNRVFVSTMDMMDPVLRAHSTNARFFYKGEEIPGDKKIILQDGEAYEIKFFKESGNPNSGYLEGATTKKYYHSPEALKALAHDYGFKIFIGDWKQALTPELQKNEILDQNILILKRY